MNDHEQAKATKAAGCRLYYLKNKEHLKAKAAAYYKEHRERIKVDMRRRRRETDTTAYDTAYRAANKEKLRVKSAAYYKANKEMIAAKRKEAKRLAAGVVI